MATTGGGLAAPRSADLRYSTWQTESGLPSNKILDVRQTRDGFLWIATLDGLARFDGARFSLFTEADSPGLIDHSITCLFEADDGTLWIGHTSGAVTSYKNGQFASPFSATKLDPGGVKTIATDENGDVWAFGDAALLTRLRDGYVLKPAQGMTRMVTAMTRAIDGRIWVSSSGQLSLLEGGRLTPVSLEGTDGNFVQGICAARAGGVWVASGNQIRRYFEGKWEESLGVVPFHQAPIHAFIETSRGELIAGTSDHGLYIISSRVPGRVQQISRATGFPSDWIPTVWEDREGDLWIGTGGAGLIMIRSARVVTPTPLDSWQNRSVLTVCAARNGGLWIGTEGAGVYQWKDDSWSHFDVNQGLQNPYVWSVVEDKNGAVFAGTWGNSIYSKIQENFVQAEGFSVSRLVVFAQSEATEGGLWIGTNLGLLRYREGQPTWVEANAETRLHDIRSVIETTDGRVWFGGNGGGLAMLKDGEVRRYGKREGLSNEFIQCLHEDGMGALWIGTFGGGLIRYKEGKFASIGLEQGLGDAVICDIEEDAQGYLWMSSHAGLLRVRKTDLDRCAERAIDQVECVSFGLSDGMPTLKCTGGLQPAGGKLSDGRLAFATSKGLAVVDPAHLEINPLAPPVVIVGLSIDGRAVTAAQLQTPPVTVPPGLHRLEFHYTGLSFAAPEKVRFRRRLSGLESAWVSGGDKRSADYNYLPPGDYLFQVKASNNDGVWNETGASLAVVVRPYFWQTLWFKFLAVIGLILGTGSLVWFETRRNLNAKLAVLEQKRAIANERARIASDMHDDLGAHLTQITMLSEAARSAVATAGGVENNLSQINDTARGLTRAMDEIVWAVNPKHDTMESLVTYLEKFAIDFLGAAGIRCRLDLPIEFPAWAPSSEVRHNLFLAFKETLNNVAKHAEAKLVVISLQISPSQYRLTVQDDGRGFSGELASFTPGGTPERLASGNGLVNLRRRVERIKGRCEISSSPGKGTRITLIVPASQPGEG